MKYNEKELNKPMRAIDIIGEVREEMCTHYCKIPYIHPYEESGMTEDEWLEKYCDKCPLDRL